MLIYAQILTTFLYSFNVFPEKNVIFNKTPKLTTLIKFKFRLID